MDNRWLSILLGFVEVDLKGVQLERMINQLTADHIECWNIRRMGAEHIRCRIHLQDFFKLRPYARRLKSRIHIVERHGAPFLWDKLWQRKVFFAGLLGFFVGLYLLSSLVWRIDVEGNDNLTKREVLDTAKQVGLYPMQWKFHLAGADTLSSELQQRLPDTSWVGVQIQGTRVIIKLVESTKPKEHEVRSPQNLIASHDALVTEVHAEKGKPLVSPNMIVKKGDILISGILGDEEYQQQVPAKGRVEGIVWYNANVTVPLNHIHKGYTGNVKTRSYLVLGNRAIQLSGYGKIPYKHYEVLTDRSSLHWQNRQLPVGWMKEQIKEVQYTKEKLTAAEAKAEGLREAKQDILLHAPQDAKIMNVKLLSAVHKAGSISMKLYFEVEQNIVQEQTIVEPPPLPPSPKQQSRQ